MSLLLPTELLVNVSDYKDRVHTVLSIRQVSILALTVL